MASDGSFTSSPLSRIYVADETIGRTTGVQRTARLLIRPRVLQRTPKGCFRVSLAALKGSNMAYRWVICGVAGAIGGGLTGAATGGWIGGLGGPVAAIVGAAIGGFLGALAGGILGALGCDSNIGQSLPSPPVSQNDGNGNGNGNGGGGGGGDRDHPRFASQEPTEEEDG
jgi:hypothetical protein